MFYADLHIHSKYSRACSKNCDLEHLAWWAGRKGVAVVGTGDFTHPAWGEELRTNLVPAEPGLFRLRPEIERRVARTLPPACRTPIRFLLSVEISTIYKRDDRTRKVHHLIYAPDLDSARRITTELGKIGNLSADGRPILGLDSRDLLEITLESDPGSYLVPAHVWTPWFSALGSKSGFDAVADCYVDLADHIFAIETGLSSDPPMNWRVGSLDRYRLVSNSDAHSPPALAREASAFHTPLDYHAIRHSLETGDGFGGTVEFFPEEGKYHLDGHRKCDVRMEPAETRTVGGGCPACGRPLTVGVLHRVDDLADRPHGHRPDHAADFRNLVPLPEIVSEIAGVGPRSKTVLGRVGELVAALGPELAILDEIPLDDIKTAPAGGELLAEAIGRLRRGAVIRDSGYDGEYGVIRLFEPGELSRRGGGGGRTRHSAALFDLPAEAGRKSPTTVPVPRAPAAGSPSAPLSTGPAAMTPVAPATPPAHPAPAAPSPAGADTPILDRLDREQRAAAAHRAGPLLIVAGPGTGKTRTLTHRLAHLVADRDIPPEQCLAITFTRRAAAEMRERLATLLPDDATRATVTTFHGLGAAILRECHDRVGLSAGFQIADEAHRLLAATAAAGTESAARRLLGRLEQAPATRVHVADGADDPMAELREFAAGYERELRVRGLADFTDLLTLPVRLLAADPELAARYRDRWRWVFVDEYQDVDETQYSLLRLLSDPDGNVTAIGDPDQAIYAFRGADVGFFLRFRTDYPSAPAVQLTRNYRSTPTIVTGALQAVAPTTLVPDRALRAVTTEVDDTRIGVFEAPDEQGEADFVGRTIDGLLGGSSFHSIDSGRASGHGVAGLGFADIAILYRTDAQARSIMESLDRAGAPFQKQSHDRLAARPGVREIAYELRHHGVGDLRTRIKSAADTLIDRDAAGFGDGSADGAQDGAGAGGDGDRAISLRTAVDLLGPLADRCDDDLERFLQELALGAEVDAFDPRADRVALLTLHAAKGLEFPIVFLIGCESGLLPLRLRPGAPPAGTEPDGGGRTGLTDHTVDPDAEERRLFFVGMTRARSRLYLSYARTRARHGTVRQTGPSPFMPSIDRSLVHRLDDGGAARRRSRDHQLRLI